MTATQDHLDDGYKAIIPTAESGLYDSFGVDIFRVQMMNVFDDILHMGIVQPNPDADAEHVQWIESNAGFPELAGTIYQQHAQVLDCAEQLARDAGWVLDLDTGVKEISHDDSYVVVRTWPAPCTAGV